MPETDTHIFIIAGYRTLFRLPPGLAGLEGRGFRFPLRVNNGTYGAFCHIVARLPDEPLPIAAHMDDLKITAAEQQPVNSAPWRRDDRCGRCR